MEVLNGPVMAASAKACHAKAVKNTHVLSYFW